MQGVLVEAKLESGPVLNERISSLVTNGLWICGAFRTMPAALLGVLQLLERARRIPPTRDMDCILMGTLTGSIYARRLPVLQLAKRIVAVVHTAITCQKDCRSAGHVNVRGTAISECTLHIHTDNAWFVSPPTPILPIHHRCLSKFNLIPRQIAIALRGPTPAI